MSNTVKQGRRSLEEKAKALEEKARLEKLVIDKKLADETLEEEYRTHNETIKELQNAIEEENHTHNDAVKELQDKIANLEQQMKPQSSSDEGVSVGVLQESGQKEVEVPKEGSKKKRRIFL